MKKAFVFLSLLLSYSCLNNSSPINKIPDQFDYGIVKNETYQNSFFDMVIPFNKDWNLKSQEEFEALTKEGVKELFGDNETTKTFVETSHITTANLFATFKYNELDVITKEIVFNPSFSVIAENIKGAKEIKTVEDYLDLSKNLLKNAVVGYKFADNYETKIIDGISFSVLKIKADYSGVSFKQEIYATLMNDFCLFFTLSYANTINQSELYDLLDSIKFNVSTKGKPKK
ncbi:hypothetical protein [Olleya sp. R77988]|uniref:hypothetical protein n=1 Tax=Olleya sp. R77988 TaxID=3093875 RepID=UPI0037CBF6A9